MNREIKHRARKRFGQNFLQDELVIQRIIEQFHPQPGERILEIGPGLGALTAKLLSRTNGQLDVLELDRDLVSRLKTKYFDSPNLTIHEGDALKFDYADLAGGDQLRIIGNLPYNISTPLIFILLGHVKVIKDMHFMLQKEVVDRLTASPGNKNYGRLSIMVQYHCDAQSLMNVPPEAFDPQPKVNSAIVQLLPHHHNHVTAKSEKQFAITVKAAFAQRRKTLKNNLSALITANKLEQLGIDPQARAETLSLQSFIKISDTLSEELTQ